MKKKNALMEKGRIYHIISILLIALFVLIQLTNIENAPWEYFNSWRQSDTYSIACNYYQFNMNPLMPQFNYDGASGNYVQLELQIVPYISAIIFKLLGGMTPVVPRLLSVLFFVGSAVYLRLIAERFTNKLCGLVAMAIYLFMPLSMGIAHATMPEACAMFFYCGSMWYLLRWHEGGADKTCIISAIFLSLAIMQKLPVAFVGLLVLMVFIWKKKFASKLFFLYGIIAVVPVIAYYIYAGSVAKFDFVSGIATKHAFTEEILSIFTKPGIAFFYHNLPKCIGVLPVIGAAAGLIIMLKQRKNKFGIFWAISILLELVTIVAMIRFEYYLVFFLPVVAILCGVLIYNLGGKSRVAGVIMAVLLAFNLAIASNWYWQNAMKVDAGIDSVGRIVSEYVEPQESVAIAVSNPAYLNAANRRGWRANIKYYEYIPKNPKEEIDYFIQEGASYFVVVDGAVYGDEGGAYAEYLQENFPLYIEEGNCRIYSLK